MNEIRILDEDVSNIIAAGEVVESPSSLVKELLENSIDAGSTSIFIEISKGGRDIRIKDNGKGMIGEDLLLSIERHATSKISQKDDLFNLSTYGFRGEALSSICAVAKVKITSKKEGEQGNTMTVLGSKVTSFKENDGDRGTEIEIKELFFNTPARLKFLRKHTTEYGYIKDIVFQEALANPGIGITLIIEGKEVQHTTGNGIENTIIEIFGRNTLKNLIPFSMGFLGNSNLSRSTKDSIYIFVNKRVVKSKIIEEAVIDGYYTKLSKGKFPFAIIFLDIDGRSVDVNVHPSKKIIKFSNDLNIYSRVNGEIKKTVTGEDTLTSQEVVLEDINVPELTKENSTIEGNNFFEKERIFEKNKEIGEQQKIQMNSIFNNLIKTEEESNKNTQSKVELNSLESDKVKNFIGTLEIIEKKEEKKEKEVNKNVVNNEKELEKEIAFIGNEKVENLIKTETINETIANNNMVNFQKKSRKVIGQFLNTYIIVENDEVLEFYDQHIVHERILYEEYKHEYMNKNIQSQVLLIPQRLTFEPREMDKVIENREIIESFGFQIEEFGKNEILIRAVPHFSFKGSVENLIRDILSEIAEYKTQDPRESIIITMSCKAAIKAGEIRSNEELEILVNKLHEIGEYTCPHGRPIILKLNKDEIEKKFKRK